MDDTYFNQWSPRVQDFPQWDQDQVLRQQDDERLPSCRGTSQNEHELYQYAPSKSYPSVDK